ncbi:hypothetical protein [Bacillus cereus]|nr:hypothetical protein [Bacillus cereus]
MLTVCIAAADGKYYLVISDGNEKHQFEISVYFYRLLKLLGFPAC